MNAKLQQALDYGQLVTATFPWSPVAENRERVARALEAAAEIADFILRYPEAIDPEDIPKELCRLAAEIRRGT